LIIIGYFWWSVKSRPSVSDDFCEFVGCCGGYHRRDRRKRRTPKRMKVVRIVSILVFIKVF
jgi:hypothetical protein